MEEKRRITLQAKGRELKQACPQLGFQHKYKPSLTQIVNNKIHKQKRKLYKNGKNNLK